ncbi:MAG: hypothetical protein AB1546_08360 [bacterium]
MKKNLVELGEFRSIHFWEGPSLVRMTKVKFPGQPINEQAILKAHTQKGIEHLLELHTNYVFAMFNWGFPPEAEAEDWDSYEEFTRLLHDSGLLSIAYIQPSNCVADGSFADRQWYALRPDGRRARYASPGRFMTCWTSEEWLDYVEKMVREAAKRGADGYFFDNVAFGAVPGFIGGKWFGAAGCHCDRCQILFLEHAAARNQRLKRIPTSANLNSLAFRLYAEWRADVVTRCLQRWYSVARQLNPETIITSNSACISQLNSFVLFGVDLQEIVKMQEVILVENHNLSRLDRTGLTYDAPTFKVLTEYTSSEKIANIPYLRGIGFDAVYAPAHYQVAIAEAASCGGIAHIKGTEYRERKGGAWTVLTDDPYGAERDAVGIYLDWIEKNAEIFQDAQPDAHVGILHPLEEMRWRWSRIAPAFFKTIQTLTELHILFRVVPENYIEEKLQQGIRLLIVPPKQEYSEKLISVLKNFLEHGKILFIGNVPDWAAGDIGITSIDEKIFAEPQPFSARLPENPITRMLLTGIFNGALDAYFGNPTIRRIADGLKLYEKTLVKLGKYQVPKNWEILYDTVRKILETFPEDTLIEGPPNIHVQRWRKDGSIYYHLVNHLPGIERMSAVSIRFPSPVSARIISPDENKIRYVKESSMILQVKIYSIIEVREK